MSKPNDKNQVLDPAATPEDRPQEPAASGGDSPAGAAPEEPKGLTGVDAAPLPPPSREEIEAIRAECSELRDQLLRKRADFENYRKRVERDKHQASLDGAASVLKALVPALDNLERALATSASEDALREGVELIHRDLVGVLESQGVVIHDPTGQPFDPNIHQALSHEVVPGVPEGTVVEVFRKGYFLRDRLLRPALVKVAAEEHKDGEGPQRVH
jgi:molecular chaperone GrpE